MSKLQELMDELCPNGVKFIELRDLFYTRNGYTPSKSKPEFWENGVIPWFRMEDIRENGRILSDSIQHITLQGVKGSLFPANSIIVATSATIGEHALILVDSLANQRFTYLTLKREYADCFDVKFLFYYCFKLDEYCLANLNQGNFASVDMDKFAQFKFPLVPLPVQQEIVRILDAFTELTNKLNAELVARQKQYEYYRDLLLSFDNDNKFRNNMTTLPPIRPIKVIYRTIGELCEISRGRVISKEYILEHPGIYPVYSSQTENEGTLGGISDYDYCGEFLTWTTDGANAGTVFYRSGCFNITNVCGLLKLKSESVTVKYLYYILHKNASYHVTKGMGNPKLMSNVMGKIKIPVPPLEEQRRIVAILDRFDALCNDLTAGLPAEIQARRRQYEHYRDKLLSFKELDA